MATGGEGQPPRRSRVRGGGFGPGPQRSDVPRLEPSDSQPIHPGPSRIGEVPGLFDVGEAMEEEESIISRSSSRIGGRQSKRPGVARVKFQIDVFEDERERFKVIRREKGGTDRETLLYLMELHNRSIANPDVSSPIDMPVTSTPTKAAKESRPAVDVEVEVEETTREQALPQIRIPVLPRRACYLPGMQVADEMPSAAEEQVTLDDSHLADQADQVDQYDLDTDSEEEHQLHVEPGHSLAERASTSLNIDDEDPLLKDSAIQGGEITEDQAAANNIEFVRSDYSAGTRLLPDNFYEMFSRNKKCRIYKPAKPDNDARGFVPAAETDAIRNSNPRLEDAMAIVQSSRYIVELKQLGKLASPKCYRIDCNEMNDLQNIKLDRDGAVITFEITCKGPQRHQKKWASSVRLQHISQNKAIFYALNTIIPPAIVLSGNQFRKVDLLFRAMNLRGIGHSHFCQQQSAVIGPAVWESMDDMQQTMSAKLKELDCDVIVSSDGQSDSPGHTAAYTTYTTMISGLLPKDSGPVENTSYVADVCVVEKRHTNLNSNAMEVAGFLLSVDSICDMGANVKEIVTDMHLEILYLMKWAHSSPANFQKKAKALLKNFYQSQAAGFYVDLQRKCKSIVHQLDTWHKAKNLAKHLAKTKGIRLSKDEKANLAKWIVSIKNHFWHCAESCQGSVEVFKAKWLSLLHHIRDEHEWNGGSCENPDRCKRRGENEPTFLEVDSPLFRHVQKHVTNKKLLESIPYFVNFRHTGELESFHQLTLAHANKRTFYGFKSMTTRKYSAAIDHNASVHRQILRDASGKPKYRVVYSKPAGRYIARTAKVPKSYSYLPHIMARCVDERCSTKARFHTGGGAQFTMEVPNDPRKLAPNLAKIQCDREEVIRKRRSRFGDLLRDDVDDRAEYGENQSECSYGEHDSEYEDENEDDDEDDDEDEDEEGY